MNRSRRIKNGIQKPQISPVRGDILKDPEMQRIIKSLPFTANGYRFDEVIGSGSFGVVFKVVHIGYKRFFAAKMIQFKHDQDENIENEISLLIGLYHPNIIKIYDSFRYSTMLVMIFQYCPNGTLKHLVHSGTGIPREYIVPFIKQIVSALVYLHEHNVAHLDIKTTNVFIDNFMRPLLADFGLSLQSNNHQQINSFAGSLIYRSPEMIQELPYDPFKADVWALGVTFYIMVVGMEPWPLFNVNLMKKSIIEGKFEIPANVDPNVADLIRRMLTVDPEQRPTIVEISNTPFLKQGEIPHNKTVFIKKSIPFRRKSEKFLKELDVPREVRAQRINSLTPDLKLHTKLTNDHKFKSIIEDPNPNS